jgi:hypothetical protein
LPFVQSSMTNPAHYPRNENQVKLSVRFASLIEIGIDNDGWREKRVTLQHLKSLAEHRVTNPFHARTHSRRIYVCALQ